MPTQHIVMFAFKPLATAADVQDVCDRMLALKTNCIHPETKKTYIKASHGGKDISKEGYGHGFTHVFVSEFENEEDRAYYIHKDPAHVAFAQSLASTVEKVLAVDFIPGSF